MIGGRALAYTRATLTRELDELRGTAPGGRHAAAYRAAAAIGGFVAAGAIGVEEAEALLISAALESGLREPEARAHVRRGLRRGAATPRELPLDGRGSSPRPARMAPVVLPAAGARPPRREVEALWDSSTPVTDDPDVSAYLRSRTLDPEAIELWDLARALRPGVALPGWARTGARSWRQSGHRLVLRLFDDSGEHVSLRARCVLPEAVPAKALAPTGYSTRGLVLADPFGVQILREGPRTSWSPLDILICEGEPDTLTWAIQQSDSVVEGPAVFGVTAGSWTTGLADRVPDGSRVVVRTHHDQAGDAYAEAIARSLSGRCNVFRPPGGASR